MRRLRVLLAILGFLAITAPSIQANAANGEPGVVAYVEKFYSTQNPQPLSAALKIFRKGRPVPIGEEPTFLNQNDRLYVLDPNATIIVRMVASRERIPVRHHGGSDGAADYEVKSAIPPLPVSAFHGFIAMLLPANQSQGAIGAGSRVIGACYNESGKTNDPVQFDVPVLTAEKSYLAAGDRRLFVSWRGGAPPFRIVLSDAATGVALADKGDVRNECSAYLPPARIAPNGHYRLSVIDANGVKEEDEGFFGVPEAPSMPDELKSAPVDENTRNLYFATWLTTRDAGSWTFEAQLQIAAMGCSNAAAQEWMLVIGHGAKCSNQ